MTTRHSSESTPSSSNVVSENLKDLGRESALRQFRSLLDELSESPDALHEAGVRLAQKMAPQKRQEFMETLRKTVAEGEAPAASASSVDGKEDKEGGPGSGEKGANDDSSENGEA